jgi:hypothetical protein
MKPPATGRMARYQGREKSQARPVAARAAARDAARAAAWDAIKPTVSKLQQSALKLIDRMIALKD